MTKQHPLHELAVVKNGHCQILAKKEPYPTILSSVLYFYHQEFHKSLLAEELSKINHFEKYIADSGIDYIKTREPGGSKGAEEIRSLLVKGKTSRWSPETEILLFSVIFLIWAKLL